VTDVLAEESILAKHRRNKLLAWYIGLGILVIWEAYVGLREVLGLRIVTEPVVGLPEVWAIVASIALPLVYLPLMYWALKSQK
jgi:hypothetical protein